MVLVNLISLNLDLWPKQLTALTSKATEILYGGAAGGGKSHLMRVAAILWCAAIPGLQVYLFRRIRDDLIKTHLDSPKGFRNMLQPWEALGGVKIKEDVIEFTNGSKIYLCHCQYEQDVGKYLSAEFHVLLIDELTTFSDRMYRQLRARVRMIGVKVPDEFKGLFPRIICGSNPGNIGHHFVKATFIDNHVPLEVYKAPAEEGGMMRQYIPARVADNKSLMKDDPLYVDKLRGLGSEALVKAMLEGDWNVVEGAYFDCWSDEKHIINPFQIPKEWVKFRACDWGSASPFSVGWYAVAGETVIKNGKIIPRGCMIKYREWYGIKTKEDGTIIPNVGLKLTAEKVAEGIKTRTVEKTDYGVMDPSAFAQDGGPSIAERMFTAHDIYFRKADNKRSGSDGHIGGWDHMRSRLQGDEEGDPMLVFFKTCVHSIRTIPTVQHSVTNPEDVLKHGEDHAADETRYACMSRPWIRSGPPTPQSILQQPTFNDIIAQQRRKRLNV